MKYSDGLKEQNRPCMYTRNSEALSCNNCCGGKTISITYSECVSVALVIHQAGHALYYRIFSNLIRTRT